MFCFGVMNGQVKEHIKKTIYTTLDTRFDYVYQSFESDLFPEIESQNYQFSDFLLQFGMEFNDQIGLVFRYVPFDGVKNIDGSSDNFQYAYINLFSKNKKWNLSLGKFFMQVGTGEQYYDPNDVYNYSLVANNLGIFKSGVTVNYTTESNQSFGVQIVNSSLDNSSGEPDYFEYNLNYYGSLWKGRVTPLLSYTFLPENQGYAINTGVMWDFHPIKIDTDYSFAYNMPNFFSNIYYESIPIKVTFDCKHFKPFMKFIANAMKSDEGSTPISIRETVVEISNYRYNTYEIGFQYYPVAGKNLRFHVVGAFSSDYDIDVLAPDPPTINARFHPASEFQFYAGIRIGVDFLKGIKNL